jgi:hypothetical protein
MSDTSTTSSGGIGLTGLLTIVFVVLKLTHVIGWSWVWVLSPIWISAAAVFGIFLIVVLLIAFAAAFGDD